ELTSYTFPKSDNFFNPSKTLSKGASWPSASVIFLFTAIDQDNARFKSSVPFFSISASKESFDRDYASFTQCFRFSIFIRSYLIYSKVMTKPTNRFTPRVLEYKLISSQFF